MQKYLKIFLFCIVFLGSMETVLCADIEGPGIGPSCILIEDNVVYGNNLGGVRVRGSLPVAIHGGEVYANGRAGLYFDKQAQVTVSGCDVFDNGRGGVNIDKAAVVTVERSRIHGNDNGGVRIWRSPGKPRRMTVALNENEIFSNRQSGVRTMMPAEDILELHVTGNIISRNGQSGIRVENNTTLIARNNDIFKNGVSGIVSFVAEKTPTLDIYQNRLAFNATAGIHVVQGITGPVGIRNNWVFNNERSGILCGLWGDPDAGSLNVEIINNTVVSNGSVDQGVGIRNDSNGHAVVMNNIVAYNFITGIRTQDCYDESYNLLFANGDVGNCCEDIHSAPYWIERTQFAGCPERGEGDLVGDPLFVDSDRYDFALREGSPAIDAGSDVSGYEDVHLPPSRGTVRNDMGATGGPYALSGASFPSWPPQGFSKYGDNSEK